MTTASGQAQVPYPRSQVWRALAVLQPYCGVCDVSYVVSGSLRRGTHFVCHPGRLEPGRAPAESAPQGTLVQWRPMSLVESTVELTPETWTTRIELADTAGDAGPGTLVTITVTHRPVAAGRVTRLVQWTSMTRVVRRMITRELDKVPAHVEQSLAA